MTQDTQDRDSAAARAARSVPHHPQPLCDGFLPQPIPASFWCRHCGWNRPLHDDDEFRQAVAAELAKLDQANAPAALDVCNCFPHGPNEPCTCDGCWACEGHVMGCTCDIAWDCEHEK